jgi:hypothetical protein
MMVAGLFLIMAGGMQIHRGPDGTWVHVTLVHVAGGGLSFCGMLLNVIAASASGSAKPSQNKDKASASAD